MVGLTFSPSLYISKWRCASSAFSKLAESPTVPMLSPFWTSSPTLKKSLTNKLEYTVLKPLPWFIVIELPYLGSVVIFSITPFSDALTTVVLGAFISIP